MDDKLFIGGIGMDLIILEDFEEMKVKLVVPIKQLALGGNHLFILDGTALIRKQQTVCHGR